MHHRRWIGVCALGAALLLLTVSACNREVQPPGFNSPVIHVPGGSTYSPAVEVTNIQVLGLEIHPRNTATPSQATGGSVRLGNTTLSGYLLTRDSGISHQGDLHVNVTACQDLKPGQDIIIDYTFTGASGAVVEEGRVTLQSVTGTCPGG